MLTSKLAPPNQELSTNKFPDSETFLIIRDNFKVVEGIIIDNRSHRSFLDISSDSTAAQEAAELFNLQPGESFIEAWKLSANAPKDARVLQVDREDVVSALGLQHDPKAISPDDRIDDVMILRNAKGEIFSAPAFLVETYFPDGK